MRSRPISTGCPPLSPTSGRPGSPSTSSCSTTTSRSCSTPATVRCSRRSPRPSSVSCRWIAFGHVESDECGAMNELLAAAPNAQVAHGALGCMVSVNEMADRLPRPLADGEIIELGTKRGRHIDTPPVPHGWDARVLYEETTGTLLL